MIRKLASSISNEKLIFISIVIQLISFCILSFLSMTSIIIAILGLFLIYSCYSTLTVIINQEIPHHVEQDKASMGLGIYNLINFLGMSFGPTMSSRILGSNTNFTFVLQSFTVLLIVSLLLMLVGTREVNTP
ncbi:hypothetical protein [Neobacillus mesonae]|uniref:hypothetical protein n=1 Tax=Neobacillus mesonae TaxID=1193713 RepID=UPI003305F62E